MARRRRGAPQAVNATIATYRSFALPEPKGSEKLRLGQSFHAAHATYEKSCAACRDSDASPAERIATARDRALESLSTEIGIELGSGYPSDPKTIAAVPQLIQGSEPHDCLRWGWATVKDAWGRVHNSMPPQRPDDPNAPPNEQRTLF